MALFGRKRRALVASASKIKDGKDSETAKRLSQPWQARALDYYDRVGEIHFAGKFYARQLSRVRFFPAELRDDGATEEIKSGPAVELLNRIQDPGGGRSRIQYDYGRLMFITGEGVLFGTGLGEDGSIGEDEKWQFVWKDEVEFGANGVAKRKDDTGKVTDETGTAYRMWTPHPKHSSLADSPIRAVLDIAEELLILSGSVRGTATTRLTNGILALPQEISPNALVEVGQEEDPAANKFLLALMDHVTAQIENPSSPESKVPFILEAAYEYLDRVRWIQTHDPQSDYLERDLRIEAIKRMALGMDLPPEALLGMTDANHWTAQQVQYDMWRAHGAPIAEQFGDDICAAYLRPALKDADEDASKIVVGYDDSMVVISPDRTNDADNAFDRGQVSFAGYRKLKGIDESLAPSEEEQKFMLAMRTRNLAAIGIVPPAKSGAPPGPPAPPAEQNGKGGDAPPPPTDGRAVSRQEARTAAVLGAAQLALRSCRAKAGAKLRSDFQPKGSRHAKGCADCAERIDGIPNAVVASALGAELLEEMGRRDPIALVKGGTDDFRDILSEWGVVRADAEVLCQRLETYAAKTLFEAEQPELPPGFASLVEQLAEGGT